MRCLELLLAGRQRDRGQRYSRTQSSWAPSSSSSCVERLVLLDGHQRILAPASDGNALRPVAALVLLAASRTSRGRCGRCRCVWSLTTWLRRGAWRDGDRTGREASGGRDRVGARARSRARRTAPAAPRRAGAPARPHPAAPRRGRASARPPPGSCGSAPRTCTWPSPRYSTSGSFWAIARRWTPSRR